MGEPTYWSIEYDVRADAPGAFVPAHVLPDATPGDVVDVVSGEPEAVRRGRVVEQIEDDTRGPFVAVSFDDGA